MTIAELYELLFSALGLMDQIFEFWLTASFAVVVASHYLSERLSTRLAILLGFLYGLFSLQLLLRYSVASKKMVETRDLLVSRGETYGLETSATIGVLIFATFVIGSVSVLAFVWSARNRSR